MFNAPVFLNFLTKFSLSLGAFFVLIYFCSLNGAKAMKDVLLVGIRCDGTI